MSKHKTIWAENVDTGKLYVLVTAVMTPIIVILDGLQVSFFGKSGPYLLVDDAIAWLEKEISNNKDRSKYQQEQSKKLNILRENKSSFENEKAA